MGAKPLPLPLFFPSIMKAWERLPALEKEIQQAWDQQLGSRCQEPVVSLTPEDLGFLRAHFSLRRMNAFNNLSPDLQIVAPDVQALSDGRWTLLVAEIHPDFTSWQHCFFVWCPDPEAFAKDYAHQGGQGTAAVIGNYPPYFTSAHTALWVYPFAHQWKFVRVAGPEGAETLRSAETLVEVTEDDVLLRHTSGRLLGSILHTWNTALNTHRLELRGNSDHSPRLQVGRVIVQREGWNLEPDAELRQTVQAGGFKAYAALREFRRKHGLPETVFVRGCLADRLTFDKDIKPVFADFRNPLLMEMVGKMIGRFERFSVTEMLPGIKDCWLEGSEGHYSTEFRTVVMASRDSRPII
jgi:Lantibiotic dehydratase, N terminus